MKTERYPEGAGKTPKDIVMMIETSPVDSIMEDLLARRLCMRMSVRALTVVDYR